jgi:hypothetical protein
MGIETNFGTYVGKMDILSSLSTLSFNKRRSAFFTKELITILQLVENDIIDHRILYGSWAGAFGNFQFMPTTIKNYAIDDNLADMLIVPASLASGKTILPVKEITKHLETNLFVTSKITGCKYGIGKTSNGFEVIIEGISNPSIK